MRLHSTAATPPDSPRRRAGLLQICVTESLERYGSFLIAALLPLFLNEHEHMSQQRALRLVGYYLALGYGAGVLGGWLADRWLGFRGATRVGTLLLIMGAALLTSAWPGTLYPALVLLMLGAGAFKPALTAWLGSLYKSGEAAQGSSFSWLYFSANIGTALAPFLGGALRIRYSWQVAFATTVVAYVLCLIVIIVSQALAARNTSGRRAKTPESSASAAGAAPSWRTVWGLYLVTFLFTMAYGQSGGALLFFARDQVDRSVLGHSIPPDFFASVPSAMVMILTVVQQLLLKGLKKHKWAITPTTPLFIGMIATGLAFSLLAVVAAAHSGPQQQLIAALWVVGALTLLTIGEVLVIPMSMALVAQYAPPQREAMAQGLLAAAMAVGLALAGEAGRFFIGWGAPRFFAATAVIPLAGAAVLWVEARNFRRRSASLPVVEENHHTSRQVAD